jgi:hypothetical protein
MQWIKKKLHMGSVYVVILTGAIIYKMSTL